MPHLAPLSWISAVILFWLLVMVIMSVVWWLQLPLFKVSSSSLKGGSPFSEWKWN